MKNPTDTNTTRYERLLAFIAAAYVLLFFGFIIITAYNPPPEWDVFTVFDVSYRSNNQTTIILTYGHGKYVLKGYYTLEPGHTYYLSYKLGPGFTPDIVLELTEVKPG